MTARTGPPFRADHVGSLLRPPELRAARERHAAGEIDALRAAEDAAIAAAVAMQEDVGLALATDGELRRQSGRWISSAGSAGSAVCRGGRPSSSQRTS